MSTIEKLIVQIFERKNTIIEQVKHQVELYDQQLASKLIIQGIDPPSWLWSHEAPSRSVDPSEIDKQRLISELLLPLPLPQQAVPYYNNFNFNSITVPECDFNQQDELRNLTCFDDVHNALDMSTEVGPAASSPQQQVATRLDDNSGLDFLRAEFKRSKSRQKALELRSSAKSGAEIREQDGNIPVVSYRYGTPAMDEFMRSSNMEKPDSAKCLNIQLDDSVTCEGIKTSFCEENKAGKEYGNIGVSTDNAYSRTELVAVFSEQVNKPMQSKDALNVHQDDDAGSAGITIQSCHGESVGQECKSGIYGSESSGQIRKPTGSADNLGICVAGGAESEGINSRWSGENNTGEEIPNHQLEHVCGSIVKPLQFQEISNIHLRVIDSECGGILSSTEAGEAISRQQFNHEMNSSAVDIFCTSKTVGLESGGQIDESSTKETHLAAAHEKCSTGATLDVHKLSTTGEVHIPSRIGSSEIASKKLLEAAPSLYDSDKDNEKGSTVSLSSFPENSRVLESLDLMTPLKINDSNSGMVKVLPEGHSNSEKSLKKFSANPVKLEISLQKNSEAVQNFLAVENVGGISGASLSCDLSNSHEHVLQSLQPVSPAVNIANTEKENDNCAIGKNTSKSSGLRTSSCGYEGGNSLLGKLNTLSTEVEVPQMKKATVEQPDPQREEAISTACDYDLLKGAIPDQENQDRVQSVSCHGTSKATEDPYYFQDNIEEENLETEASTSSFGIILGKVETEAPRLLSHEPKQAIEGSVNIEEGSKCLLEGSHLSLDVEANLNKERYVPETFSIECDLGGVSYVGAFEENAFKDAEYYGMKNDDQSKPVFEGFVMETDEEEPIFAGDQIDIEESSSTLRRASFLERLCKPSSRNTPVSEFPKTFELHKTSDLFQSVPPGLLEHISLVGDCTNMKVLHKSYSARLPVSTDPFSFNVSTPPFNKKWDRSTSSSELKFQESSNSEHVCFTIEEDPGICDEIGNHDKAAEAQPSHSSSLKRSLKRKPLTDITEDGNNLNLSVSVNNKDVLEVGQTPKFIFRSQLDSTGTEANATGAQTKARQMLGKKLCNKKLRINSTKENRNVSMGTNGSNQVTDAVKETKPQKRKYSENQKTITGVSDQKKVTRSNNIVSNMSSFIPLVQQKKAAAAIVTGKRDVKVKALEAAEAAKRLAEKKENERKAKKEAWKAEKVRLEQENLLQAELRKKQKEEELKKKEAEMAARKRIREEEEKKEKEGKRRRVEEAWKQQQEQGRKKADKLIRHQTDVLKIHEKDPNNGLEQCTKTETGGRIGRITTENEDKAAKALCNANTMLRDLKESSTLMKADIGDSNLNSAVGDPNATAKKNLKDKDEEVLQSYDISPYDGSDDECEDEDDENENHRRKEKFLPAWASKNSLAEAVFSQQHINPDEILPPGSFPSIAEVLVPRKLRVK